VGAESAGERARSLLDIGRPDLDFVGLAKAMGVPAVRVDTAESLGRELARAMREPGPCLVEVIMQR
jgi:acetolactate synthase-1/2/3 large subunit